MPQRAYKTCQECKAQFTRPPRRSAAQWERMTCCSAGCANAIRARGGPRRLGDLSRRGMGDAAYEAEWQRRNAMPRWAAAWENRRRLEDEADLLKPPRITGPTCRIKDRPEPRHFIGWYCRSCAEPFVYYAKRAQSPYCADCNDAHHRRPAARRARQNGARYEVIVPRRVFERDHWKCQLCGTKTTGSCPDPRSATVDHIVPLAKGGDHTYLNVQCACFDCNTHKGDRSANDQLRLLE